MKRVSTFSLSLLPYLFVFIASLYLPTDPDLGWHLKYGEYFFQHHQLLRDNIFSTMMPDYHWANGSWGTDIITYALYKSGGFPALSLAGAGIVTLTFFFVAKAGRLNLLSQMLLFPLFIFLLSPVNSDAFRGQQLSYLFLALFLFLLSNYKPFTKKSFFIPLLFLVWCNIHEEAFLFLGLFGARVLFILIKSTLDRQKIDKKSHKNEYSFLLCIFVLTCLVTFTNPFGLALQSNALSYLGNGDVRYISEYEPYTLFSFNWWEQIAITVVVIVFLINASIKKKIDNHFMIAVTALLLLLLGFSMRRYIWPAYYLTFSFISIPFFIKTYLLRKYKVIIGTIVSLATLIIVIQYKLPFSQFTTMSWDTYCLLQTVQCSPQSARFLQSHHFPGKIFSYYDWGGWIIWNYPTIKPSIDGRMTEWKDAKGYSASADYAAYENAKKSIDKSPYDIIYLPNDNSPLVAEVSALIQQKKWKAVYTDERAGIAVRIKK